MITTTRPGHSVLSLGLLPASTTALGHKFTYIYGQPAQLPSSFHHQHVIIISMISTASSFAQVVVVLARKEICCILIANHPPPRSDLIFTRLIGHKLYSGRRRYVTLRCSIKHHRHAPPACTTSRQKYTENSSRVRIEMGDRYTILHQSNHQRTIL